MTLSKYRYASEKFLHAVIMLATGSGDVRSRLLHAWQGPLWVLNSEHLPRKLQNDFIWIENQLHKYKKLWPGQLDQLRKREEIDPQYKEKYHSHYPNPVESTLRRIKNTTGSKIAHRIFSIYCSLEHWSESDERSNDVDFNPENGTR